MTDIDHWRTKDPAWVEARKAEWTLVRQNLKQVFRYCKEDEVAL
jgi:hypothetical protein